MVEHYRTLSSISEGHTSRGGARSGAGRPKGSVSASPRIRQAFLDALDAMEEDGTPLSSIIRHQLETAPTQTLRALAHFEPRENRVEAEVHGPSLLDILSASADKQR